MFRGQSSPDNCEKKYNVTQEVQQVFNFGETKLWRMIVALLKLVVCKVSWNRGGNECKNKGNTCQVMEMGDRKMKPIKTWKAEISWTRY